MKVFSFGGGVQSTAALVLAARGELACEAMLFANVGDDSENPDTLAYVRAVAMPYAARHGIKLIEIQRRRRDGSRDTLYGRLTKPQSRSIGIPALLGSRGVPGRRQCTVDFKIRAIAGWCWTHGARKSKPATTMLGISLDEFQRMRTDSGISYTRLAYPLIDRRLTRAACHRIIVEAGLPTPPKSSCWFCPYHSLAAWRRLAVQHPDLWQKAIALENMLSERAKVIHAHRANYEGERERVYLSSTRRPLPMLASGRDIQAPLFEDDACESGYCMV